MQRIYIDADKGDDAESGLSAARPLATFAKAMAVIQLARFLLVAIEAIGTFDLGYNRVLCPAGSQIAICGDGPDKTIIKSTLPNGPIVWLNDNATVENLSVVGRAEKQFQYPIGDGGVSARNITIRRVRTQGPTDGLYFTGPQSAVVCEDSNLDSRWDTVFLRDGSKALLRRCELRSLGPNAIHPHQHGLAQCLAGSILRLEDCAARMRASNSDRDRKLTGIRADDGGKVELANFALSVDIPDWQSRWDLLAETGQITMFGGRIDCKHCRGNVVWAG